MAPTEGRVAKPERQLDCRLGTTRWKQYFNDSQLGHNMPLVVSKDFTIQHFHWHIIVYSAALWASRAVFVKFHRIGGGGLTFMATRSNPEISRVSVNGWERHHLKCGQGLATLHPVKQKRLNNTLDPEYNWICTKMSHFKWKKSQIFWGGVTAPSLVRGVDPASRLQYK